MKITKGLPDSYTAVQMHLHWGGWDLEASGAEHTLDGIRYMAEVRQMLCMLTLVACPACFSGILPELGYVSAALVPSGIWLVLL